jgi:hypothetical protein
MVSFLLLGEHVGAVVKLNNTERPETQSNNSFNLTALSVPFINIVSYDVACVVSSGGGLIRALGNYDEAVIYEAE